MIVNIFSIPAISLEIECVFSKIKNTASNNQASLDMESIQATNYLKSWYQSGLFIEPKFGLAICGKVEEL